MKEEWPKFHLSSAMAKGEGTLRYASWTQWLWKGFFHKWNTAIYTAYRAFDYFD